MKHARLFGSLLVAVVLCAPAAHGTDLKVNCARKKQTIGRAIAKLPVTGRHTITVRGECREAVVISGRPDLTIRGVDGASIQGPGVDAAPVVSIRQSPRVRLQGLAIRGGGSGVECLDGSNCYLENLAVSGASRDAIVIGGSRAWIDDALLENNGGGLRLHSKANVTLGTGSVIRGSRAHGILLQDDSVLVADAEVSGNAGHGVSVEPGADVRLSGTARVTNNGEHGLFVHTGTASIGPGVQISGNGQDGVRVSALAQARFNWAAITGNRSGLDVNCEDGAAVTFNARDRSGGGTTNCADAP